MVGGFCGRYVPPRCGSRGIKRRAGAGVGDQRLVLGEVQVELFAQERGETLFDLLGFGLGSGEPEQGVVGVAAVTQPPVAGIIRVLAGQAV